MNAPIKDGGVTEEQIVAAARALCKHDSDVCGTDVVDNWTIYSSIFRTLAQVALEGAREAQS